MSNWREEYFLALGVRDAREQANAAIYDACVLKFPGVILSIRQRLILISEHETTQKLPSYHSLTLQSNHLDTRLADRTSQAHSQPQSHHSAPSTPSALHRTGSPAGNGNNDSNNKKSNPSSKQQHGKETSHNHEMLLVAARQDLSEAQRSRTELVDKLAKTSAELEKLRRKTNADARRIEALVAERTLLLTRVKDRDEELRGKAKLLD
ncbi:hypothetical protein AJ78_00925, partial [Emergomyces pasteurianus Ep9510]